MRLCDLAPARNSKKSPKRLGRGIGSGLGKTCGKGHKGQKARSGCKLSRGFEGGQTPLYRRLPKFGFTSLKQSRNDHAELRLHELNALQGQGKIVVDILSLKEANLVNYNVRTVKVIKSGEISKPVILRGIKATKGAIIAIEAAGGQVEE